MQLEKDADLFGAVRIANNPKAVAELLKSGANVNAKDEFRETPLIYAAQGDSLEIVKVLVTTGAKIDFRGEKGWTPLRYAVDKGKDQIVRFLIDSGADVNSRDKMGESPLYWAVFKKNIGIARLLIANGAEMNFVTAANSTCLLTAVSGRQRLELVRALVESGADLKLKANEVFVTAVLSASAYGGIEVLEYLLNSGLEYFATYPSGQPIIDALERFHEKGTQETITFLKAYLKSEN